MSAAASQGNSLCPVCNSDAVSECIGIAHVPIYCNVLHGSREAAMNAAMGDIDLLFCSRCGHLFNAAFDPERIDYTVDYENSLHYSERFRKYARALAERLIEHHGLRGKTVIEIACGQGDFLELLCVLGGNRGIGFDPSHVPGRRASDATVDLRFIRDYYSEAYADWKADLICCRHALEHIARPGDFLHTLRSAIGDDPTPVFFEVPDSLYTLRDLGIWDIIYEHCGYFCEGSLSEVFRRADFNVKEVESEFGGQFLAIYASPARGNIPSGVKSTSGLAEVVHRFADHYRTKVDGWGETLRGLRREGRRTVLWGAGSKGISFVNLLGVQEEIACLIDLNPHKDGKFVPGTGHRVRAPGFLTGFKPEVVIVMNPLYADEIGRDLREMGLSPEILVDEPA